jgi:carboxyl-terminal processing protease
MKRVLFAAALACFAIPAFGADAQMLKPRDRSESLKRQNTYVQVWDKLVATVQTRFYDPQLNGSDFAGAARKYRAQLKRVKSDADFLQLATALLNELRSSHVHVAMPSDSPDRTVAFGARLRKIGPEWVVTEVDPLSDARRQGLRAGEVLLSDPDTVRGALGSQEAFRVLGCDQVERVVTIRRERPGWPAINPAFRWSTYAQSPGHKVGYLRADRFDDGAAELADQAMADLKDADGLIIDLRWNSGGNASALRLASYFTEGSLPGLILLSREYLDRLGHAPTPADILAAPRVDRPYTTDAVLAGLAANGGGEALWTEDLGERRYTRPVVVLIGENTGSAAEGFAWVMKLKTHAVLMGRRTEGALLSGEEFELGSGWRLTVPTAGIWGPDGKNYGDKAVQPDAIVPTSRADLCAGRDPELQAGMDRLFSTLP